MWEKSDEMGNGILGLLCCFGLCVVKNSPKRKINGFVNLVQMDKGFSFLCLIVFAKNK